VIKLLFCLRRRTDLSRDEFQAYWRDTHGPLVQSHAATLGIHRYVQSHSHPDDLSLMIAAGRHPPEPYDGVAELWFGSLDTLAAAASTPEGRAAAHALFEDEQRFIDHARSPLMLVDEHPVIAATPAGD
jgi:uncharacterized protein (TIGR02118 family)